MSYDVLTHRYGPLGLWAPPLFGRYSAEESASVRDTVHAAGAPFRLMGRGLSEIGLGVRNTFRPPGGRNLAPPAPLTDDQIAEMIQFKDPSGAEPYVAPGYGAAAASTLDHRYRW